MKITPVVNMDIPNPKKVSHRKLAEILEVVRTDAYKRLNDDYFLKGVCAFDPELRAQTRFASNAIIAQSDIFEQLIELTNRFNYNSRNKILAELKTLGKTLKDNLKLLHVDKDIRKSSLKDLGHIIAVKYSKLCKW